MLAQSDEAKKILERIAGTKVAGDNPLLARMRVKIAAGDRLGAAVIAQEHPNFLNVTVKQHALKMSTREETLTVPFNDFAASFVGVTRDALDARLLLTGDFHYRAKDGLVTKTQRVEAIEAVPAHDIIVPDEDVTRSNTHFESFERMVGVRQSDFKTDLVRFSGQLIPGNDNTMVTANPDPAGVLTSRAFLGAHTTAGTNRRPVEFTFRQFMCVKMEDWSDTGASDARVGRDIDRLPAGNPAGFLTTCKGCHTGMDGFRGAFARWDYYENGEGNHLVNALVHTDGKYNKFINGVARKMSNNANVYPSGFVTTDNGWVNNARGAANNLFGWRGSVASGTGVKDFGTLIANSKRFSQCMVKRVFESTCRKDIDVNSGVVAGLAQKFEADGYKLNSLFADVVVSQECGK